MTMRETLTGMIEATLADCYEKKLLLSGESVMPVVEYPGNPEHGDFATNVAMQLAKFEKKAPRAVAEILVEYIKSHYDIFDSVDIAGPGFINFKLKPSAWQNLLLKIDEAGKQYGYSNRGNGNKVQVEFVSANPTGPLHIGHGRGAAIGDAISRLLEMTGWNVTKEFYYNDAGQQISNLALSVQARCLGIEPDNSAWPADGYQGEYIKDIAAAYLNGASVISDNKETISNSNPEDLESIREFAVAWLRREQDQDLLAFDVSFDNYFLESSLYTDGSVSNVVKSLTENGYTYNKDDALWLKTTEFGDDKDRVMQKSDGNYTYFVPDVAYHLNKWKRGFIRVINEQGADHHSTVTRVRAGLQALNVGIPKGWPEYVLHQMVTVMRGGEEVKISKRAGSYVTLRELIDEVGKDATRHFFLMRKPDSQLVFDIDLAKKQSVDNPVYYVQYAHARICRIFESAAEKGINIENQFCNLELLKAPEELAIIKTLGIFPEIVEQSALNSEPHKIATYLQDLAAELHSFYNKHRVLGEDIEITKARLFLLRAVLRVIKTSLNIFGVSAPERM